MAVNLERAAMRGMLMDAEQNARRLELRIEAAARSMRQGLNTMLTPVAQLDIAELDTVWDDCKLASVELAKVQSDIIRLQRELR